MRSPADVAAMQCPVCHVALAMSDRQGIEIDYCPQCRGVWLDRGELDKIIERSGESAPPPPPAAPQQPAPPPYSAPGQSQWDQERGGQGGYGKPYYKKRKHWLSEIFD